MSFPIGNIGTNLATLAATVAGNLYDLGEATGLKLMSLSLPADYRAQVRDAAPGHCRNAHARPASHGRPLLGTIIKPNVGMSAEQTGALVGELCAAGLDFIKDDEVCAEPGARADRRAHPRRDGARARASGPAPASA